MQTNTDDLTELQRKLKKAESWADQAESDAEYQGARQLIIWFELQIRELTAKAA